MRKYAGLITMITCVIGSIGLFCRWVQIGSLYEASTGLAIPGLLSSRVLIAICIIAVSAILISIISLRRYEAPPEYRDALRSRTILYPAAALVAGIMMAAGGVSLILTGLESPVSIMTILSGSLAVLSGTGFPALAMGPKKGSEGKLICLFAIAPMLFFCCWLLAMYKTNSSNPVLWSYGPEVVAVSASALGFFYMAGYAFDSPKPKAAFFFSEVAAFFSLTVLGGTESGRLIYAGSALMLLIQAYVLISNMIPVREIVREDPDGDALMESEE